MAALPPNTAPPPAAIPGASALARPAGAPSAPMPGGGGGFAGMMSQLAQRGANGQLPPQIMTLMIFLAGMGFEPFSKAMNTLTPKQPPKSAVQADAMRGAPGMAVQPNQAQMLAQLAQRTGMTPGAAVPLR